MGLKPWPWFSGYWGFLLFPFPWIWLFWLLKMPCCLSKNRNFESVLRLGYPGQASSNIERGCFLEWRFLLNVLYKNKWHMINELRVVSTSGNGRVLICPHSLPGCSWDPDHTFVNQLFQTRGSRANPTARQGGCLLSLIRSWGPTDEVSQNSCRPGAKVEQKDSQQRHTCSASTPSLYWCRSLCVCVCFRNSTWEMGN